MDGELTIDVAVTTSGVEIPDGGSTSESALTFKGRSSAAINTRLFLDDELQSPDFFPANGVWEFLVTGIAKGEHEVILRQVKNPPPDLISNTFKFTVI
ncbi:hypothetical protein [Pseudomonas sp. S1_E04]